MYKVAFVSGASRGIGRAIATSLAKEGYHLDWSAGKIKRCWKIWRRICAPSIISKS
ncbi:hypothetical protein [Roseburia sp. AM51-8]|uniref:hypothetical protein n=1 Tax=Roseburia sp. AM51-8 TaxID=2292366 RepID=UPI002678E216|nr:hypothetical protein [Roseburia sp. AM51-8]